MLKQIVTARIGIVFILICGLLITLWIQSTEALDLKQTKYEKWNCCPGFNPDINFKSIQNLRSINSNEIIQNIEINQICENVEICLIDLSHLNSQISYSNIK